MAVWCMPRHLCQWCLCSLFCSLLTSSYAQTESGCKRFQSIIRHRYDIGTDALCLLARVTLLCFTCKTYFACQRVLQLAGRFLVIFRLNYLTPNILMILNGKFILRENIFIFLRFIILYPFTGTCR